MRQKLAQLSPRQWLLPRFIDGVGACLYLAVFGLYAYFLATDILSAAHPWGRYAGIIGSILFLLILDRMEYLCFDDQPGWRQNALLMLARLAVVSANLIIDDKTNAGEHLGLGILIFGLLFLAGSSYGLTGLVWLTGLIERVEHKNAVTYTIERDVIFHFILFLGVCFIFYIAYLIRQERQNRRRAETLLRQLEESHRQLQAYAAQVADMATTEERNRLAREIHDSLGHYLTVINVQLEKALVFRDLKPAEADQAVRDSKRLAGEALQEVRQSVGALRHAPEPFSLIPALAVLAETMRGQNLAVDLKIEGKEEGFSRQSLQTLYRTTQEGLTNIQKHAQAGRAEVHLRFNADSAELSISDDGCGFDPAAETNGPAHYGLLGVRERLELIQGTFALHSSPGAGVRLVATVPKNPATLTPYLTQPKL